MKSCSCCKLTKTLDLFSPDTRTKSGKASRCKECQASLKKQKYAENPQKYRKAASDFVKKNYLSKLEANNRYRKENPEKVKQWKAKDRAEHKNRINADNAKRRAQLKTELTPEIIQMYALRDFYIAMSLGESFHVDHITPLAKGGIHSADNLQVIPAIDNLRKGSK
jgi:hypothetical protein